MKLYRAFATVGLWTLLSRLLGFVRDMLIAKVLGTGLVADAFVVAFRFPNLFRRIFAEGAFNSAFVPLFAKHLEGEGKTDAKVFAEQAMTMLLVVLLILVIAAQIAMPWLMYVLAPGFAKIENKHELAVTLTQIAMPYLLFVSLTALLSGIANTMGRFAVAAAAPVLINIVLIVVISCLLLLGIRDPQTAGYYICWGVFAAGILQFLMVFVSVRILGMALKPRRPFWTSETRLLVRRAIPGTIAGGATQINLVIGGMIASMMPGAASYLYYTDRIYQLPLGLVGVAIGVVLLPDLSRNIRAGNMISVRHNQNRSLEFALLLTLPAAVAMFVIPEHIVRVLFERGAFNAESTKQTAMALSAFAWGVPAFVMVKVFQPAFFAREDTKTPMVYSLIGMGVNTTISLSFLMVITLGHLNMGLHVGIGIAEAIAAWLVIALMMFKLNKLGYLEIDDKFKRTIGPIIISSIVMGIALYFLAQVFAPYMAAHLKLVVKFAALLALVTVSGLIYMLAAHLTGALHLPTFLKMISGRKTA